MLTFLHAADFHLDSPFHALPRNRRRNAGRSSQLLTRLADTARQAQVDLVFLAGDLFDGQRARPETVQALYQVLEELEAEVFLSPATTTPTPPPPLRKVSLAGPRTYLHPGRPGPGGGAPVGGAVVYGSAFTSLYRMDSPWPASTPRRRTWPLSAAFMGTSPPPTAATAPSPTMKLPPRACTIWPWATATAPAAWKRAGKNLTPGPAARRGGALTRPGDKGSIWASWRAAGCPWTLSPGPAAVPPHPQPGHHRPGPCPGAGGAHPAPPGRRTSFRISLTGTGTRTTSPISLPSPPWPPAIFTAPVSMTTPPEPGSLGPDGGGYPTGLFLPGHGPAPPGGRPSERPLLERAVRFGLAALEGREEPQ